MIGKRMKELRQEKGYSLNELASKARVSKSYLSYLERNLKNNPSLQFLSKIADTLDTSIEYLLGEGESEEHDQELESLDEEWVELLKQAIDDGMSKDDLQDISNYIRFKNWTERKVSTKE
jgi:XRE family transcriptional regulator of biofilm formation